MSTRSAITVLGASFLAIALCGCGRGSGSSGSGGGGGGGGGGSSASITTLAPSNVMVGIPVAMITVLGQGFTGGSQVLIDGQLAKYVTYVDSSTLQVNNIDPSFSARVAVHQFSVTTDGTVSNSVPYNVYAPQQGPSVMQAFPGFLVSEHAVDPPFIVAVDVNGDGLSDVIMPGPGLGNGGSIAILTGQANGTLATAQYVPVPITPYALTAGDVDGNGTTDLVSIASLAPDEITVSVLLGDGHGNFQPPSPQQTISGIFPGPASLADLNGDGQLDLVLDVEQPSGTANSLVWLKNVGGGFGPATTLATTWGSSFAVADFNADGKPDILYTKPATATSAESLHILMNQGNGKFVDQAAGGLNGVVGFTTAVDFNLDGIPDLVVQVPQGNAGVLYSFQGVGNGSFTQVATTSIPVSQINVVTGDFDHDGFPDLVGTGGVGEASALLYLFGDGHGNFTLQPVIGPGGQYCAKGDFNGDGTDDVVVADMENFVALALGRSGRNFPSPLALTPATVSALSTGDINGDGLPEIVVGGSFSDFGDVPGTVFLNQGNSSFQLAGYTDPYSSIVVDLTGKGVVDLVGGNANLEIWPNNRTLTFSPTPITLPQPTSNAIFGDMDGDGYTDFVSGCEYGQCSGQVFYGNGAYQFNPVTVPNLGWPYVIGNFTGSGKLDIATPSGTFLNEGGGKVQEVVIGNNLPLQNGGIWVVGDFNGDGKDDVAINPPGGTSIIIYYSNGDGTFYQGTLIDPGQYPGAMAVGDFNGDGRTDLAVGLFGSTEACIFFNSGNGQFTRSFFVSGASTVAMVASDLNHNGKTDLVIGNFVLDYEPADVNVVFHQ